MNVLFVVTHPEAGGYLAGLVDACRRKGVEFSIFFTGDGVRVLENPAIVDCARHAVESVVCEHAWSRSMAGRSAPVTPGSQTDHSRMLASATRVVSL
ncbi:MAG: DsrE family protein [Gammaproteobacteria bacterium]